MRRRLYKLFLCSSRIKMCNSTIEIVVVAIKSDSDRKTIRIQFVINVRDADDIVSYYIIIGIIIRLFYSNTSSPYSIRAVFCHNAPMYFLRIRVMHFKHVSAFIGQINYCTTDRENVKSRNHVERRKKRIWRQNNPDMTFQIEFKKKKYWYNNKFIGLLKFSQNVCLIVLQKNCNQYLFRV